MNGNALQTSRMKLHNLLRKCGTVVFYLEELKEQAKKCPAGDSGLLNYINKVLDNPQFQKHPRKFLDAWKVKRGLTEEWRIPEDQARAFFDAHLNL